ncbi:MAG: hypothetical protein M3Q07_01395, partial [Pseudobdellovibrionaceae bacterium]|nr:hypothetical protein [Pseudobdellovibrionaceae bacterium]
MKAQKRMTYADFLVKKRALSSQLKRKFAAMAAGGGLMLAIVALGGGDLILTSVSADVDGHDRIHIANGIATILYLLLILAWYICEYIS